jgi:hypothetical protein
MLKSLLYVSARASASEGDAEIAVIAAVARSRNALAAITGALIATDQHFAQILEGPPDTVDAIMASIRRDPRHSDVTVVAERSVRSRWFSSWTLSYAGPSSYVASRVRPLLATGATARDVARLIALMREFSHER